MPCRHPLIVGVLGAFLLCLLGRAPGQEDKAVEAAMDAIADFVIASRGEDVDAIMKTVDIPFYHNPKDTKIGEVIRDREALKKFMERIMEAPKEKNFGSSLECVW